MKRYPACILATCCVPWSETFDFEEEIFRRSVRHLVDAGLHDIYIFGTAGEGHAVTESQFDRISSVFLNEAARHENVRPMIGLISQSLPTIIERIERARDFGATRFQLSLPNWGVLTDKEVDVFFRETCGRFSDCTFLHYNLQRAGRILTGAEYGRLAGEHSNLVATKNSTADEDRLHSLLTEAPQLQHFITEFGFAKAALMGECGFLISFASTNLARAREFFEAGRSGDVDKINEIARDFPGLIEVLKTAMGDSAHMDAAYDKLFCRLHDPEFPLRTLPPYASSDDAIFERYLSAMKSKFPHWL